jgi:hypothetical protein
MSFKVCFHKLNLRRYATEAILGRLEAAQLARCMVGLCTS